MAPTQRRGPWVPEEDQTLLQLVRSQGPNNWVRISQHMQFRSPKQCRERFHQNLKPSLNHEPISAEEGMMIERMVHEMGKRWAEIARRLGNRSDNAVKNWWNGSMNRKRRGLIVPGSGNHSPARTLNGRVDPPYPRRPVTMRSPCDRSSCQDSSYGARRTSWVSIPHRDQQHPGTRIQYPQTDTKERRELCSSAEYEYDSQFEWPRRALIHRSPIRNHRKLSPIVTYVPHMRTELPTIPSPSSSEISNPMSSRPPSMVSDHNSICSASPRTAESPSMLPVPVEIHSGQDGRRRGSAPTPRSFSNLFAHDESYHESTTSKNIEYLPELAVPRRWAPGPPVACPQESHRHQHWKHQYSNSAPQSQLAPTTYSRTQASSPPRDSRMGLETLLN
ncbi:uncharacterized protein PADG_07797 [Paracoccidioides brasiliensis Pb18]|uniref:MYB family conidiophore development protein FlbD n=1 Tax=Paracoccidioides brasiliensis (strain Pb18) TaxID=502780 RepID=C1GKL1_PARBD|nr:uncharacterized protein PADG_07797 [Paracoccidioides brasiliensis Pb18]EEH42977.1 hypothetical protein PADG_07797 [Paracoccidioides brasiliensis Pb18]